jgi:ribosomal protein S18 acetylase RimI-like enzyme
MDPALAMWLLVHVSTLRSRIMKWPFAIRLLALPFSALAFGTTMTTPSPSIRTARSDPSSSTRLHHQQEAATTPSKSADAAARVPWIVRPASPDDERDVTRLLQASYGTLLARDYSGDVLGRAMPLFSRANPLLLSCPTWFVVEHPHTQQIVGCGGWTPHSPSNKADESTTNDKVTRHLRHFATDPAFARRGVASALWTRVLESLRHELGGPSESFEMEVYSTITAVPFYESCGFAKVQETSVQLSPDCSFPCSLMKATFPSSDDATSEPT